MNKKKIESIEKERKEAKKISVDIYPSRKSVKFATDKFIFIRNLI